MTVINWIADNQVLFFCLLFVQYAVLMTYQSKLRGLKKPLFIVFIIQDWVMNMFMTLWFLDPPEKLNEVVTKRMKRYKSTGGYSKRGLRVEVIEDWRYYFAVYLCQALNKFDPDHC